MRWTQPARSCIGDPTPLRDYGLLPLTTTTTTTTTTTSIATTTTTTTTIATASIH